MNKSNFGIIMEFVMILGAWIISTLLCKYVIHSQAMIPVFLTFVIAYLVIFAIYYFITNAKNKKK